MSKYEQLIEYIINEQEDKARELFHSIVVEKSREIYESLIDEEDLEEVGGNEVDQMVDEITGDEQGMAEGEDEDMEADMDDMDADMGDMDAEMDAEEGEEGELEDRVMDLEDALDELKAEFDQLMAGEAEEEEHADMFGGDEGGEEEMPEEMMEEEVSEEEEDDEDMEESVQESKSARKMTEAEWIREYVEKIGAPSNTEGADNTTSVVAGKNDMGGKVVGGSAAEANPTGPKNPSNAYTKGQGEINSGNRNVPGAKASKLDRAPSAKKGEEGGTNTKSIES